MPSEAPLPPAPLRFCLMSPGLSSLVAVAGSWSNVMLSFAGFGCWRWELRFILISSEFFYFLFFLFISPSFGVDDRCSLLQHRSHWEKMALGAFLGDISVPLPFLLGLLVFFSLPPSASVSLLPASPAFGSPIHSPWNPNPSCSPILLQAPTASGPPTHLWPPGVPPSLSGLPSHYSASHPPPASNPFSASQPFPNSHSSFWPDSLIFGWTPPFTAGHSSYTLFETSHHSEPPFPSRTTVLFSFCCLFFFFLPATLFLAWHPISAVFHPLTPFQPSTLFWPPASSSCPPTHVLTAPVWGLVKGSTASGLF